MSFRYQVMIELGNFDFGVGIARGMMGYLAARAIAVPDIANLLNVRLRDGFASNGDSIDAITFILAVNFYLFFQPPISV